MSDDWLKLVRDPKPWSAPHPLPEPVETERVIVRLYRRGDGPSLHRAICADRASLLPWMVWARLDHQSEEDSIYYVERSRRKVAAPSCTDFPMAIFDRASGELLGGTGLHDIRTGLLQVEVGYWVRGDRQGQGICTEAVGALVSSALGPQEDGGWGLRRVVIYNAVENLASRRVCQKLGLRLEKHAKRERYLGPAGVDGALGYHDTLGFAVLRDEWDFGQHRARPDIDWPDDL